jgi:GNAT superfamily N-acetyltransferase
MRPFTADDLPRLHAIREAAFAPIFHSFREIVGPDIAATVLADAEAEQAALLDAMCAPGSEWSVSVVLLAEENAVHPDHAGRGIGSWMYREALAELTRRGARVATVGTGGDPAHAPARRAYEKAGFGVSIPSIYAYKLL